MTVSSEHPDPLRRYPAGGRDALGLLMFGLIAAPIAWGTELAVNYALASHACFPAATPFVGMRMPGSVWLAILVINIVALLLSLAAAAVSYRNCHDAIAAEHHGAAEIDRRSGGRAHFMTIWGGCLGLGFFVVTGFNLIAFLLVPACYI